MKKWLFVTASAVALAAAVPTFVAEAAGPVDSNAQVVNESDICSASPEMAWLCRTFYCLCDPQCKL
ncbi:hypothetical protein FBZ93_116147 [Bradyrhizobium macuxiense]|uniref:Uncharacterized protein n=1 Tax=Bradyrhizobium macuxiense TaxID=1755647 RepID=A0A560L8D9_9BRAD|nr:hypothetical protein FBZ93_116147 [Bradyrhizobium macuxiense]